jgi:hypothetical protein
VKYESTDRNKEVRSQRDDESTNEDNDESFGYVLYSLSGAQGG